MLYVILKTEDIPVTFTGSDYAFCTCKAKQVACYNKFTSRELVYCENALLAIFKKIVHYTLNISCTDVGMFLKTDYTSRKDGFSSQNFYSRVQRYTYTGRKALIRVSNVYIVF